MVNSFSSVNRIRSHAVPRCYAMKESSTSFQSYTLVVSRQKFNPLELLRLELKLLFGIRRTDSREIPVSRAIFRIDNVEFRWTRFLMSWRFLMVLHDCSLSTASRTVTGVAVLLEPFDCPPDIWRRDAKLSLGQCRSCAFLAHVTPTFCIINWLGICKKNVQCDKKNVQQIVHVILLWPNPAVMQTSDSVTFEALIAGNNFTQFSLFYNQKHSCQNPTSFGITVFGSPCIHILAITSLKVIAKWITWVTTDRISDEWHKPLFPSSSAVPR